MTLDYRGPGSQDPHKREAGCSEAEMEKAVPLALVMEEEPLAKQASRSYKRSETILPEASERTSPPLPWG